MKNISLLFGFIFIPFFAFSQCENWGEFELQSEDFTNPAFGIYITPECDKLDRPYA